MLALGAAAIARRQLHRKRPEHRRAQLPVKAEQVAQRAFPNLAAYEARVAFQARKGARKLPDASTTIEGERLTRDFWGRERREKTSRPFQRAGAEVMEKRRRLRVGMPRVLNMYSTGPFFRTYFEVLGLDPRNVLWSDDTSEELWLEGGKYGSVDPCFPAKVVQAHFHNLLFHQHKEHPLDVIFFPILTHVPSFVKHSVDHASCPIVAGTPDVMKAAFTKEQDYFGTRGITYLDPSLSFSEPVRLKQRLFETFKELLGLTEDESHFAADEGFAALERFDLDVQRRGREILEQVEAQDRLAILMIGRPYHLDPGLHHGIPEEFQAQGYPILTIRSIPKDEAWLSRFFADDLKSGLIRTPLEVNDVWPENYSANSAMKVWAAKFAARHPNVVLLDLSSFKCGHDAPTYGIIDRIVEKSAVPHLALHDIDANKPGGSIKIRVKTYVHSLRLHEERLEDLARKKAELARKLDEKRLELLRMKQTQLEQKRLCDPMLAAQIEQLAEKVRAYQAPATAEEPVAKTGLVQLRKKSSATADANATV
jgi:predicted nucleotide-binding protein (sugar kinase/HSP70/actin superfamily)